MTYFEPSKHLDKVYRSEYRDIIMCGKVRQIIIRGFNPLVERVDFFVSVHRDPADTFTEFFRYMLIRQKEGIEAID